MPAPSDARVLSVLHASYARRHVRGGERQLVLLVEQLAERGVRQGVICRAGSGLHEALFGRQNVQILPARHHMADWLHHGSADILHAHEARAAYWAGLRGNLTRTPYVITRRVLNRLRQSLLSRVVYRGAAAIVGVSNAVCQLTETDCRRTALCIHDAHQGLVPDAENVRRIRAEIDGSPIIGQVAALVDERKGQSASIAAFRLIRDRFPNARLVLLGTGPDERRLKELASSVGGVLFPGYRQDIGDWTAALDLLLHPSARDALASSLLDAMLMGVAVVANRVGGIPEIARHDDTALLAERGDTDALAAAAIRLLADDGLRRRITGNARRLAETLSPAKMADAYLELYGEMIRSRRDARSSLHDSA